MSEIELTQEELEALELAKKAEADMEFAGSDEVVSEDETTTDETVGESAEEII